MPQFSLKIAKELRFFDDNIVCEGVTNETCNATVQEVVKKLAPKVMTFEEGWFFD